MSAPESPTPAKKKYPEIEVFVPADMKKLTFSECVNREFKANGLSTFYSVESKPPKKDDEKKSYVGEELSKFLHSDAVDFAAKSWSWINLKRNKALPRRGTNFAMFPQQQGVRAYYRVISEQKGKYILLACHINVHGFHRGDLRFVEVTDRTITRGMETTSVIGKLFPGDIVAVTELCRVNDSPWEPPAAKKVNQESKCIWEVSKMTVLSRQYAPVVFGFLENKTAVAKGREEVMNVILDKNSTIDLNTLYDGDAFIPEKVTTTFCSISKSCENALKKKCSYFAVYPKSLATIFSHSKSEEETDNFQVGIEAFKEGVVTSIERDKKDEIVETCARMGYSAANSVFNGRMDSRSFPVKNARKENNIVRFSIANPPRLPTEGKWNTNSRIELQGFSNSIFVSRVNAVIETAIADKQSGNLQIVARLSRDAPKELRFNDDCLVSQREILPACLLRDGFFKKMKTKDAGSNGRRVITTLYGGPPINIEEQAFKPQFVFPSINGVTFLNKYQNEYVQKILIGTPMILASSPFGCGKSMTIVTSAIEIHAKNNPPNKKAKKQMQLILTQSNYACVNLVEIARKVDPKFSSLKFMRVISEKNWIEMPDSCRTILDTPHLMREYFKKWATGNMSDEEKFCSRNLERSQKKEIIRFLIKHKIVPDHMTIEARKLYDLEMKIQRKVKEVFSLTGMLFEALKVFYNFDVIMITADSLHGFGLGLFKNVSTIQIDEASQVPEYITISLLSKYPNANFGLIGDIKQLPPYCEEELTGKLKDFGIGNTMERAIDGKMFPLVNFRYVYRCHPKITALLSDLFYDGELISGITEDQRNEFITRRSDFWPNPDYPIAIIDNQAGGHRMGTSCGNNTEKELVKKLVETLTLEYNGYKLEPSDIGVISFYSAQTAVLTEAMRGSGVKCGTVDSFQGSEREVIILCCTNENISEFMQLGNRLNVAISRARQATIIIGNVNGLEKAKYWKEIVKRVEKHGCLLNTNLSKILVRAKTTKRSTEGINNNRNKRRNRKAKKARAGGSDPVEPNLETPKKRRRNRGGRAHRKVKKITAGLADLQI